MSNEISMKELRADTVDARKQALAAGDAEKAVALTKLIGKIDDALDDLAVGALAGLASRLNELTAKLEVLTREMTSWPSGNEDAPEEHERPYRGELPPNDEEDAGPGQPAPPPPAPAAPTADAAPVVSPGWSQEYLQLWQTMTIQPAATKTSTAVAKKIIINQSRYATAVAGTPVPWWFVAVVHCMECSLRFDQHLHNGDPLTARTVRVPRGRPPLDSPPFSWEESARDAVTYEKLDKVTDWSLPSVLYHWHRYNGINNEYKRRRIATPYLWSGSQHYRKGKYVADHKFDPEAVSGQVGAAVIFKALVDLGAVAIDQKLEVTANPTTAAGEVRALKIDLQGAAFKHAADELDYPGPLKGQRATAAHKRAAKSVQEWLNLHGCVTPIDGDFGDSTVEQLRKFQTKNLREATGDLDPETWALLTAPMRAALAKIDHGNSSLEAAVLRVAQQHIERMPTEAGGNNRGPWVRLYMQGDEGTDQKWCAGFICLIVAQAARDLGVAVPFHRQVDVDALVQDAKTAGRYIREKDVSEDLKRLSWLRPGYLFVLRASASDWTHVGIVKQIKKDTFDTFEGNTGGDGGVNGTNARQGNRNYVNKDFIRLL